MKITFRLMTPLFLLFITFLIVIFSRLPSPKKSSLPYEKEILQESMKGVHAQRFDQQGRLIQVVTMESWLHYKNNPVTQMISPTLKIYHQDGSLWDISADTGEGFQAQISGKLEKLQLSKNVVVQQIGCANNFWWELKTEKLLFFVKKPMALTDNPVVVTGPGLVIHATGIRAFLDDHYIEFVKNVKTQYEKSV